MCAEQVLISFSEVARIQPPTCLQVSFNPLYRNVHFRVEIDEIHVSFLESTETFIRACKQLSISSNNGTKLSLAD